MSKMKLSEILKLNPNLEIEVHNENPALIPFAKLGVALLEVAEATYYGDRNGGYFSGLTRDDAQKLGKSSVERQLLSQHMDNLYLQLRVAAQTAATLQGAISDLRKTPSSPPPLSDTQRRYLLNTDEQRWIRGNNKIQAIKEVRNRYGLGLKEAKDIVDEWAARYETYGVF